MKAIDLDLVELCGEFEHCSQSMAFVVDITTSNVQFSEGGMAGFVDYGISCAQRIEVAVSKLRSYAEGKAPS